jgi:hypothetical protein
MCAAMLSLQAVVLFLTGVVSIGATDVGAARALILGGGLAVTCVVAAGLLRWRVGYWLGWLIQGVSIALGVLVTIMFFLGALFAALWATAYFLGAKVDRERAEREVLEERWRAEHQG